LVSGWIKISSEVTSVASAYHEHANTIEIPLSMSIIVRQTLACTEADLLIDNGISRRRAYLSRGALMSARRFVLNITYTTDESSFDHLHNAPHLPREIHSYTAVAGLHIPTNSTRATQRFLHHGRPRYVSKAFDIWVASLKWHHLHAKLTISAMFRSRTLCSEQNCCPAEQGRALPANHARRKNRLQNSRRSLAALSPLLRQVHRWRHYSTIFIET
jgi:hypothetical protein